MGSSPSDIAPLLLRNLLTSIFFHAHRSLFHFSDKYKIFHLLRSFLVSVFDTAQSVAAQTVTAQGCLAHDNFCHGPARERKQPVRFKDCVLGKGHCGIALRMVSGCRGMASGCRGSVLVEKVEYKRWIR